MFKCDADFNPKSGVKQSEEDEDDQQEPKHLDHLHPCFISTDDHAITVYYQENIKRPVFESSISRVRAKLDNVSKTLAIYRKKAEIPSVVLYADISTLEKLDKICRENSDESLLYSPLIFTPNYKERESFLTKSFTSTSYRGMGTLAIVGFIFTQLRNLAKNYATYGLLPIDFGNVLHPIVLVYGIGWFVLANTILYISQKLVFQKKISKNVADIIGCINFVVAFVFPADYCHRFQPDTLHAFVYVGWSLTMIMKMASYMHFMHELRGLLPRLPDSETKDPKIKKLEKSQLKLYISPENLKVVDKNKKDISKIIDIKDLLYFYAVPTLVYQLYFPRTPGIRWNVVLKLAVTTGLLTAFITFWMNQYFIPIVRVTSQAFREGSFLSKIANILDMANSVAVLMPVSTYLIFHSYLNFMAELLCFGDRDFYKDWWNSERIRYFWNRWNRLVHKWCQRHVYFFILKHRYSKVLALTGVFLFSGIMHEYLFSIPSRIFVLYSLGFMSQVPIIMLERKFDRYFSQFNTITFLVWAAVGYALAPLALVQYYVKYLEVHQLVPEVESK